MMKKKRNKMEAEIVDAFINSTVENLILQNPKLIKKPIEEIRQLALKELKKAVTDKNVKFVVTIDHTETLLKEARINKRRGDVELSAFWYATYFEHKINFLIHLAAKRLSLTKSTSQALLRKPKLEDKCTWILEILKIRQINKNHIKAITNISEIRNRYIHYKWNYRDMDKDANETDKILLQRIEKTVRYIISFEEHSLFKGIRKKARH